MRVTLLLVLLAAQIAFAQPRAGRAEATRVFAGAVNLRTPAPATVNVAVYSWVIRERQTIPILEVPLRGTAVFQLRAGSLTTVIDGRRQLRQTGEFFTVRPGQPVGVETDGDTAILEAVIVAE